MAVDRNLFLHDLAIVAIMKNEGPYLKEWLDYHLVAGVDHFYIYDNDSTDNQAEVAKPYVEAGLVDYFSLPGKMMQYVAYNDAITRFKFHCRYMAIIDADEFILPKTNRSIVEVIDEILSRDLNAAALGINWHCFGSNGRDKADYSVGVLERFTCRAQNDWFETPPRTPVYCGNIHIKTIANPRAINFIRNAHFADFFEGLRNINENGKAVNGIFNQPVLADKIVINHYFLKSKEEYFLRSGKGKADGLKISNDEYQTLFNTSDRNEEFDDGILKYREARAKVFKMPDKTYADARLLTALAVNLAPTLLPNMPQDFYAGKMETFLTCRAVSAYLKTKLKDAAPAEFYEEAALKAILKTLSSGASMADARLLISELPNLLTLPYPVIEELRGTCLNIIQQIMNVMHLNNRWKDFTELDYLQRLLQTWK